jgi:D-threo-aldose 1-dehydrogenase
LLLDFVRTDVFSSVLSHNRYTLLDRSAEPLLVESQKRGVAFVNGAPYGGGMLVKGPDVQPNYAYRPANEVVIRAARAMPRACATHGVPLPAAALQFSLREPRVASTVVGVSDPARIAESVALAEQPIQQSLWEVPEALAVPPEVWLN